MQGDAYSKSFSNSLPKNSTYVFSQPSFHNSCSFIAAGIKLVFWLSVKQRVGIVHGLPSSVFVVVLSIELRGREDQPEYSTRHL